MSEGLSIPRSTFNRHRDAILDIFGIIIECDRIVSLELTEEKFNYDGDFRPADWFRDCYGIVRDPNVPVEKVVLRAFGKEAYYLRNLPLHHSQKEIETVPEYSDFELTLSPTAEFFTALLARGAAVKVLSPQWLADEIKSRLLEAAELY